VPAVVTYRRPHPQTKLQVEQLIQHCREGMSAREIADQYGMHITGVRARIRDARKKGLTR
jgi:transposase